MSWLIEEESMDRFVLDDIGGIGRPDHFEEDGVSDREDAELIDLHDHIEILPPMDFVTLRSSTSALLEAPNIFHDADQESIHSSITILLSCSSSSRNTQLVPIRQDLSNSVSVIDETDASLSINANSIDSSILTEFSGTPCISSVNSFENSESLIELESVNDTTDTTESVLTIDMHQTREENLKNNRWYNKFESEEKWDEFQEKTKLLLDAVECPMEDRDEMIAQLISMEEQMFWNSNGDQFNEETIHPPKLSWLLEVAALSASIAVAGVVLVRLLKCR
jgi:hypothetical protein